MGLIREPLDVDFVVDFASFDNRRKESNQQVYP